MEELNFLNSPFNSHNFSAEETTAIRAFFTLKNYHKKTILLSANKKCKQLYFVVKGCLHLYFIDDAGIQRTTQFAIENWWLTDFINFPHQEITDFNIETVEASEVLSISTENYVKMLTTHPKLESYFRKVYEVGYGAALQRIKYIQSMSKEEMYLRFKNEFPQFVERVPQYLLASFLGLTPEYLSEIKKKSFS